MVSWVESPPLLVADPVPIRFPFLIACIRGVVIFANQVSPLLSVFLCWLAERACGGALFLLERQPRLAYKVTIREWEGSLSLRLHSC